MLRLFKIIGIVVMWLANKAPEISRLDRRDALLAKIVIRVTREAVRKELRPVPLGSIRQIHPLERRTAREKMRERVEILRAHKKEIIRDGHIGTDQLKEFIPSVTPIRAVIRGDGFIAFEGNGRVGALQEVFADDLATTVDVEVFILSKESTLFGEISNLRKRYSLE